MNFRSIFIISILFVFSMLFAVQITTHALLGKNAWTYLQDEISLLTGRVKPEETNLLTRSCSRKEALDLSSEQEPHLVKLREYQSVCDSFVTDTMMIFIDMPKDNSDAQESAKQMSEQLHAFHHAGVRPLVVIEPVTEWGLIDFEEFSSGFYDDWIDEFFLNMKEKGVTDRMMGVWIPFPEANLPYWNHGNASPRDFAMVVNRYLTLMKSHFPDASGSILLNSTTYETDDFNWANGEYVSLLQYVEEIDSNLVESLGIQGFPWLPRGNEEGGIEDPQEFLAPHLAIEAAEKLGVKSIWFNTGTFSERYTNDPEDIRFVNAETRKNILFGILDVVTRVRTQGFEVSINLFSQDKSEYDEATNWSYWIVPNEVNGGHELVFINFMQRASELEIPVSLFDKAH